MIDLRSDTVTKPTPDMLKAMCKAEVGDDVYKEDPTVNALEERVAALFGKDQAVFFPSGTMANQAALKLHTQPGDQVICHKYAHIYNYEGGGASFNSGISCKLLDGDSGMFTASQVEEAINPPEFYHSPLTSLVEIENTTNKGGGACWDVNDIKAIQTVCKKNNLGFHLDGARLWNALVAKNETANTYGELFDTISVCFSKGLGCPAGSMLVGNKVIMQSAIRVRKILGGGMRQIGYLAAAALYALDNNIQRLNIDHFHAKQIAFVLQKHPQVKRVFPVETNIIIFELKTISHVAGFIDNLKSKGIFVSNLGDNKLRMVTHLNFTKKESDFLLNVFDKKINY